MSNQIIKVSPSPDQMVPHLSEAARQIEIAVTDVQCGETDIAIERVREALKEIRAFLALAEAVEK